MHQQDYFGLMDETCSKDLFHQDMVSLAGLTKDEIIEHFRASADECYLRRIMGHRPEETERARRPNANIANWVERARDSARKYGIKIIEKDSDLPFAKEPIDPRKKKKKIGIIARLKKWLKGDVGYKR